MRIEELVFADATPTDQRACYDLVLECLTDGEPGGGAPSFETFIRYMTDTGPSAPRRRLLLARAADGSVAGTAIAVFPVRDNTAIVHSVVRVAPRWRRRGVGSALLADSLAGAADDGRSVASAGGIGPGTDAEAAALALGYTRATTWIRQILEIRDTDPALWRTGIPEGFRLEFWQAAAPEDLLESYARARAAIVDAPLRGTVWRYPEWTAKTVREYEERARRLGEVRLVAAAVHEATGTVAGVTELALPNPRAERVGQRLTAILPEFRRRGLALAVKGAMMHRLIEQYPQAEAVINGTAADNAGMIAVNERLGYRTLRTQSTFETDLKALQARIAGAPDRLKLLEP